MGNVHSFAQDHNRPFNQSTKPAPCVLFITIFAADPNNAVEERGVKDVEERFSFGEVVLQEINSALCGPFGVNEGKRPVPILLALCLELTDGGSGAKPISISRAVGPASGCTAAAEPCATREVAGAFRGKCNPPSAEARGLGITGVDRFGLFGSLGVKATSSTAVISWKVHSTVAVGAATAVRNVGRPPLLQGLGPAGAVGPVGG